MPVKDKSADRDVSYDVWSVGPTGDIIACQKKLAKEEISSVQTAKRIIKNPTLLYPDLDYESAMREKERIETTGLKCELRVRNEGNKN